MIAAVYARKSTEQHAVDEEKSVARQVQHATRYAEKRGWGVDAAHIYVDDGISGAEFLKRPGFLRLMNALKPRPPFQALIMSEESRLGREQIETAYALKQIIDAGVRVFFYLEDRERTLDSALEKVMLSLTNFAAEMEREKARLRTRDAMQRKASRGHVAGGKVYGYRNVEVTRTGADGQVVRDHVEREVVPSEAAIVRRIFEEVASGRGFSRIAKGLNADRIPSPTRKGWAMTGVRELVLRDLYRGLLVWGKTRWVDRGGTKVKQDRPESEWLVVEAPHLRIVDGDLWRSAHARLERTRQTYLRRSGGRLYGRPESGIESGYLLTGFLTCAACGGGMSASWRSGERGGRRAYYRCNAHRTRPGMCDNALTVPTTALEEAILRSLRADVLAPDIVEAIIARAVEIHRSEPDLRDARRERLTGDARRLQDEAQRLAEAVRMGGRLESLVEALRGVERQRADVLAQLEHLDGLSRMTVPTGSIAGELRRRLAEWSDVMGRHPAQARQILRKLLLDRVVMTPSSSADARWYEYAGHASYGKLLAGVLRVQTLVPPG